MEVVVAVVVKILHTQEGITYAPHLPISLVVAHKGACSPLVEESEGEGGGAAPSTQQNMTRNTAPMYSNIIKCYANWNLWFS